MYVFGSYVRKALLRCNIVGVHNFVLVEFMVKTGHVNHAAIICHFSFSDYVEKRLKFFVKRCNGMCILLIFQALCEELRENRSNRKMHKSNN